jgi:transposase
VLVNQARRILEGVELNDVAALERHRQALELVDDIEHLDTVLRESRTRITAAVTASATTLTESFGVGSIVAAMLIGYSGDPTRFTTASRYAAYTGTAPIEFSSGGRVTHRLSRRGNRRLNHALHCAAITQIRHRHSPGRGYYDRDDRTMELGAGIEFFAPPPTTTKHRPTHATSKPTGTGSSCPGQSCRAWLSLRCA